MLAIMNNILVAQRWNYQHGWQDIGQITKDRKRATNITVHLLYCLKNKKEAIFMKGPNLSLL